MILLHFYFWGTKYSYTCNVLLDKKYNFSFLKCDELNGKIDSHAWESFTYHFQLFGLFKFLEKRICIKYIRIYFMQFLYFLTVSFTFHAILSNNVIIALDNSEAQIAKEIFLPRNIWHKKLEKYSKWLYQSVFEYR